MKSIRETIRDIIEQRILPRLERDGISKLLLPEQIIPADCVEPVKGNRRGGIRQYEYLIGFGLTGKIPYCVGDKVFVFTPGAIVLMPRWIPYGTVQVTVRRIGNLDVSQASSLLWMTPLPFGVHMQVMHDVGNPDVIEGSVPYMFLGKYFDRLATCLLEEVRSRLPNYEHIGQCILKEFLERCLRSIAASETVSTLEFLPRRRGKKRKSAVAAAKQKRSKKSGRDASANETAFGQLPLRIQVAREFIHSNYHRPIGLEEIAHAANISADHFGRQFKASIGITPIRHLLKVRMEMAEKLLLTSLKICEVARMVGIEDARYFSRLFHQSNGDSPLQYRRKMTKTTK